MRLLASRRVCIICLMRRSWKTAGGLDSRPAFRRRAALVCAKLEAEYGKPAPAKSRNALDQLCLTVLSQSTTSTNTRRSYERLRAAFPTWERVMNAPLHQVARAIKSGGLARVKAARLQASLRAIHGRTGKLSLAFLGRLPDKEALEWLVSLPGIGWKTASCVMLFALGRPVMPVDTHVLRLSRRLGLAPHSSGARECQEMLESVVAPQRLFALHLNLIAHGRRICRSRKPLCRRCVLSSICPSADCA
jgi:endonuclease-3